MSESPPIFRKDTASSDDEKMEGLLINPSNSDRIKAWDKFFTDISTEKPRFLTVSNKTSQSISELRVIEQDVMRTRSNEPFYEHKSIQYIMKRILIKYCAFHSIQYMQGLNEILAPLITFGKIRISATAEKLLQYISIKNELSQSSFILSSTASKVKDNENEARRSYFKTYFSQYGSFEEIEASAIYQHMLQIENILSSWDTIISNIGEDDCIIFIDQIVDEEFHDTCVFFEKIVDSLAPTVYRWADVQSLQTQLASLHLLLYYFDADLAKYLSSQSMSVDIYAQSWLITLFARRLNVDLVLYLWDLLCQVDNPCFIIFLAVAFLRDHRDELLALSVENLPEKLVRMHFTCESEINSVFQSALLIMNATPASVILDISKFAFDTSVMELERMSGYYDLMVNASTSLDCSHC
jgi:hypothetical protein